MIFKIICGYFLLGCIIDIIYHIVFGLDKIINECLEENKEEDYYTRQLINMIGYEKVYMILLITYIIIWPGIFILFIIDTKNRIWFKHQIKSLSKKKRKERKERKKEEKKNKED